MALDLEEQEQLDEFKAWWNKNGKLITNLVIAALLAYAGWQGYQYWMNKKATEASSIYQQLISSNLENTSQIKLLSKQLMDNYDATPYAGRAAVFAAKSSFNAEDIAAAKTQLNWALSNAKEESVQAIANLELASILFSDKEYDAANKLLNNITASGFLGLKDNLLGDILLAQDKTEEAKAAFENALKNLDSQGRFYQLTKQKLESLG